jgi:hypothetical protein
MVAGFTWVKGSPSEFVATPMKAVTEVTKGFDMGDLVKTAAELMQQMIRTRGTGRSWSGDFGSLAHGHPGRTASSPGRVASGHMVDSVAWRAEMEGGKLVGEFGWLTNRDPYFLFQEEGFRHNVTGEKIAGMMALEDAGIQGREEFLRRLSQALKR